MICMVDQKALLEYEDNLEATVLPRVGDGVAVGGLELFQLKPRQVQILHYLHQSSHKYNKIHFRTFQNLNRVLILPFVDQVVCCPPVCKYRKYSRANPALAALLTAGNPHLALLPVQRVELRVHRAGERQRYPAATILPSNHRNRG